MGSHKNKKVAYQSGRQPDNQKEVYFGHRVDGNKQVVRNIEPESYDKHAVSWGFRIAGKAERWSICADDWNLWKNEIYPRLCAFEGMTWSEVKNQSKSHGSGSANHNIAVNRLSKEAKKELQRMNMHCDEVFSLRFQGEQRLFGILEQGVMYLLWYDKHHEICPSHKK